MARGPLPRDGNGPQASRSKTGTRNVTDKQTSENYTPRLTEEQVGRREEMKERGREHRAQVVEEAVREGKPVADMKATATYAQAIHDLCEESFRQWLPQRVRQGMEERGLSVNSLARLVGMPEPTLRGKMREGNFAYSDVAGIAAVLGVTPDWFMPQEPLPGLEPRHG